MNVAIVIDSLSIGGAQKHVRQLACGLAEQGDKVTVWVLNNIVEDLYVEPLRRAGVEVRVVGQRAVLTGLGLLRVAETWRSERVELVVVVLFVSTVFGRLAAQLAGGVPIVTSLQARNVDYSRWQRLLVQMTAGASGWTISNSRSALRWAVCHEGVCATRSSYIPNMFDPVASETPLPSWTDLGLPEVEGRWVVGSLGRLSPQKGYDVLLRGVAMVPRELREQLAVVIWGEGPERPALLRLRTELGLDDRVHLPGQRADAVRLLRKFDGYVQPSRFEGTPNAVLEALSVGLPLLVTAVDGLAEEDLGPHARRIPPDDAAALADGLTAWLRVPAGAIHSGSVPAGLARGPERILPVLRRVLAAVVESA